jgi:ABC-type transport system involved in cytochrome c biogenesis permease subunit
MRLLKQIVFTLLGLLLVILIGATILEKIYGTGFVSEYIYSSVLFVVLWGVFVLLGLIYILQRKLQKQLFTFLLHISFLLILAGAFTTWLSGEQGNVHLRKGEITSFFIDKNHDIKKLPFNLILKDFRVLNYTGTDTPMDFVSVVEVAPVSGKTSYMEVAMNQIGAFQGYRFYQSGYDIDGMGTTLSVSHDPYGIAISYTGYVLLLLSMLLFFLDKNSQFRQLIKSPLLRRTALIFMLISCTTNHAPAQSQPKVLPKDVASHFGDLNVYYNGRICPLQTLAKDFTVKVYGKSAYKGYSSEQVFTGWMFFSESWEKEAIIKIKSKPIRELLGITEKYATFDNFINSVNQYKLAEAKTGIMDGSAMYDKRGIEEADEKFNLIASLYSGQMLKIFPYRSEPEAPLQWYAASDQLPREMDSNKWVYVRKSMDYIFELIMAKDYAAVNKMLDKLIAYQQKEAGADLPSPSKLKAEKTYNHLNNSFWLAIICMVGGIFLFINSILKMIHNKKTSQPIVVISNIILGLFFAFITLIISLRGYVAGHIPLASGFETMQFMAWCTMLITILIQKKFSMALPFGFLLSGLTLMVAFMGESNPQITLLMPVLSSPLLSIHVVVIMLAYSLLAFIMLNGATALVLHFTGKDCSAEIEKLYIISRIMLYPATFLLTAGIFIGAVWANITWGRYWGWDPKEVWALITLLIYSLALHPDSLPWFRKPLFFHIFSIIAFLSVLVTYFGVNFILGGMHSYAG